MQTTLYPQHTEGMKKELINLFHESGLPLYFNKTGKKEFTNYQRISLLILFVRSKKSLRDFIDEDLAESKWVSWLDLKKTPRKSTIHDWMKMFKMKTVRKLSKILSPKEIKTGIVDGTGIDSHQKSRHYEKRINDPPLPNSKADLFIDADWLSILDFSLINHKEHDVKIAERIFKRNKFDNIICLADKGYDSEPLHILARSRGITLYAPVRKTNKNSSVKKKPKGKYRQACLKLPILMGKRSLVETVNSILKRRQISFLRNKKLHMKQKEFAWHVVLYNMRRKIVNSSRKEIQTFIFCLVKIIPIRTEPSKENK